MDTQDPRPTIGFDIGGTNLRAGVVDAAGRVLNSSSTPTPRSAEELEDAIVDLAREVGEGFSVGAIGLAIAGFLDPECETVRFAPHLPWRDTPVRSRLAERLDVPVRLEHDANSAAWGEYRFGAGQGAGTWVLFAVGTGIGATLMIDGEFYRGAFGTAPEFGHLTVVPGPGGRLCSCGKKGCLERYASGTALVDTARELAGRYPTAALARDIATGGDVTGTTVMEDAGRGDPLARAVINDFADWLGVGLSFVADVLDPELIVLGGGVAGDAALFLERASEGMAQTMVGAGHRPRPRLATAQLGGRAGMIGVADLARFSIH
ncbi:glucokinase [Corynebacterium yudongzhengii]|uniref:Glucokinase n=1 Tax=Corynebacterium yudongzhengii TaxID=2080740 RepID=A0A2U1T7K8_9CORY|nr:ROK family protein [Corynebacterium yudongzhengii]AWB81551.1 glucokinase [Corynebacterium yudongzhengii]PWC01878.1 glucokinase [Corynebacterium yudongzhengii]